MEKKTFEYPVIKRIKSGMPSKFGMKTDIPAITHIDSLSISELESKYGSPVYILSEETIRATFQDAKRAFSARFPKVQFAWSYKTNYLDAVCKIFHDEGSWAEVVSGFEYEKAINNGVPGNQIIFNGPEKSRDDLIKAINNGSLIHVDHFDELFTIFELANKEVSKKPKLAIRINMDTGIYPKWDRFGFNYENGEAWDALKKILANPDVDLVGLHTHIGTYILSSNAYRVAASKLASLVAIIDKKYNKQLKYIDMGGGFASKNTLKGAYMPGKDTVPSFDDYADAIAQGIMSSEIRKEVMPLLILETGRALIDDAGYLLGKVLATKRLSDGRRSLIIDIGVNLLFTSFWYEHEIHPGIDASDNTEESTIFGPLCMNIDVIRQNIDFPVLQKDDPVVIKRIGAYNMTQWLQFITYRPNIVLIDSNGKTHIIREKENMQTFTQNEKLPNN